MTMLEKLERDNQTMRKKIKELEKTMAADYSEIWEAIESICISVLYNLKRSGGICMRTDQFMGLSAKGSDFVKGMKESQYSTFEGAFYNKFPLMKYEDKDGNVFHEEVQKEIWSSGPVFFNTLMENHEVDWTDKQMAEYVG